MTASSKKKDGSLEYKCTSALAGVGTQHVTVPSSSCTPWPTTLEILSDFFFGSHSEPLPRKHQKSGTRLQSEMYRSISLTCFLLKAQPGQASNFKYFQCFSMTSLSEAKYPILISFSSSIVLIFNQEVLFQGGHLLLDINHYPITIFKSWSQTFEGVFVALVIAFQRHYRESYVSCYLASACVLP